MPASHSASIVPANFQVCKTWKPDKHHWDINLQYGLTLPRYVNDTPVSRTAGTAGMPIEEVRLYQILHNQASNWLLRPIAHGRFGAIELFRSVKEAMLFSKTSKVMKDERVDLDQLFQHIGRQINADHRSKEGTKAILDHVGTSVVHHLQSLFPKQQDTAILDRLRTLEAENAELRNMSRMPTQESPIKAAFAATLPVRSLPVETPNSKEVNSSSSKKRQLDSINSVTCNGRRRMLATNSPKGSKGTDVTSWLLKSANPKARKNIEDLAKAVIAQAQKLPPAEQPSFQDLAAEWGLPVSIAGKMDRNQLARMVAAAAHLSE